jgi:hypothetical protein
VCAGVEDVERQQAAQRKPERGGDGGGDDGGVGGGANGGVFSMLLNCLSVASLRPYFNVNDADVYDRYALSGAVGSVQVAARARMLLTTSQTRQSAPRLFVQGYCMPKNV